MLDKGNRISLFSLGGFYSNDMPLLRNLIESSYIQFVMSKNYGNRGQRREPGHVMKRHRKCVRK